MLAYDRIMGQVVGQKERNEHDAVGQTFDFSAFSQMELRAAMQQQLRAMPHRYKAPTDILAHDMIRHFKTYEPTWFDDLPDEFRLSFTDIYEATTQGRHFEVVAPPRFVTTLRIDSHTVRNVDTDEVYPLFNKYLFEHLQKTYPETWSRIEDEVVLEKQMRKTHAVQKTKKKGLGSLYAKAPPLPAFVPIAPPDSPPASPTPPRPKSPPRTPTAKTRHSQSVCPQYHNDAGGCRANAGCEFRKDNKCRKKTPRSPKQPPTQRSPKQAARQQALPQLVPLAAARRISATEALPAGVPVVHAQVLSDAALAKAMPLTSIRAPPKAPVRAYKPGGASYKRFMAGRK